MAEAVPPLGRPIESRYVADDVVDRLVTAVGLGVYVGGQQLPTERELAAMLGVSRTSVREALKQLTASGYLEVRRGRNGGYFVLSDWGPDSAQHVRRQLVARWSEFEHIFDARTLVEPMIARTAAARRAEATTSPPCRPRCRPMSMPRPATPRASRTRRSTSLSPRRRTIRSSSACRSTSGPRSRSISAPSRSPPKPGRRRSSSMRELVAAIVEGRGDDAAEIAARHFAISEALIRKLADRAQHDGESRRSALMSGQLAFILRRLLLTIPMLFVMSVVVFLIIRLVPGDPVRTMLGFRATDENVAEVTRQLGLDRPPARAVPELGRRAVPRRSRTGHRQPRAAGGAPRRSDCR